MEEVKLLQGELIEDLQFDGLKIILSENLPSFTTDAVLLSDFARMKRTDNAADLGTGTGILPLLAYGRYGMRMTAFEIQPALCDMASRSFALNGVNDRLCAVCMDVRDAYREYNGAFSAVVCNPPYFADGLTSDDAARALTRSQVDASLGDFCVAAKRILKSGGAFYICYPAKKMTELMFSLRSEGLEPKRMRLVRSTPEKMPYLVLIEAKKDGGAELVIEKDLIVFDGEGRETDEIKRIYHRT